MNKLKPCPFCGGPAILCKTYGFKDLFGDRTYVECEKCGAKGSTHYGDESNKAVLSWNTRLYDNPNLTKKIDIRRLKNHNAALDVIRRNRSDAIQPRENNNDLYETKT